MAVEFSYLLATPVGVSRVAGDSFQREIVTLQHCQSLLMPQPNIQQHNEAVAVHHLGVASQSLARKTCDGGQISNLAAPLRVSRVAGGSFQREIVM